MTNYDYRRTLCLNLLSFLFATGGAYHAYLRSQGLVDFQGFLTDEGATFLDESPDDWLRDWLAGCVMVGGVESLRRRAPRAPSRPALMRTYPALTEFRLGKFRHIGGGRYRREGVDVYPL